MLSLYLRVQVLIEEDSADRSPSRDSNRRQSRADVYEDDDEEPRSPSRGRSTSPHSQASPTPRRASQEDSHRALEPASAVLQGVKASSPIPTEAVTVNLERIQPAPVPAHRSTPTAARSNGRQVRADEHTHAHTHIHTHTLLNTHTRTYTHTCCGWFTLFAD